MSPSDAMGMGTVNGRKAGEGGAEMAVLSFDESFLEASTRCTQRPRAPYKDELRREHELLDFVKARQERTTNCLPQCS